MTIIQCTIAFIAFGLMIVGVYVYIYHVRKQQTLAITVAAILMAILLLSIIFILPFPHRSKIIDTKVSQMQIEKKGVNYYAICDDGTEYKIKATNTSFTSGYNSYANDDCYKNVKVDVTYRYDYKI